MKARKSTQLTPIPRHHEVESADLVVFSGRYAGFGKFQVDLQRQGLFLEGQRVKLHAKVYQALTLLLSRAGEVVTREEVRKQLWPDTFLASLSLDANVNTTMNKLRQVLGDALENPQYIETIRGRGYRFIAHVQFSESTAVPTCSALRANAVAIPPKPRAAPDSRLAVRAFALKWPNLLRLSSLLVAGMLLGALLTFVWFLAQKKSHRVVVPEKSSPAAVVSDSRSVGPLNRLKSTAHGKPGLYHETITWAFMVLIRERIARTRRPQTWPRIGLLGRAFSRT